MRLDFKKYQGAGNDFILVDNRAGYFPKDTETIIRLCDRKFGIGSDGLILIEEHPSVDFRMVFYNPDGSQSLCGNGSRCGFAFAQSLGMVQSHAVFETTDGIHQAKTSGQDVSFSIFDVTEVKEYGEDLYLNTGSPHYVHKVDDLEAIDVVTAGRRIRYSEAFAGQNGTNVNFVQLLPDRVRVRTYERGVEDETLSCGTGVTAVGLVASRWGLQSPVQIETRGGNLTVSYDKQGDTFTNIWLTGPATFVFEGSIEI